MSLDVYLYLKTNVEKPLTSGIFIREGGKTIEITKEEWIRRHPDVEPVIYKGEHDPDEVYTDNITHNLNSMANAAGIYEYLWRPELNDVKYAKDLVEALTLGLDKLKRYPDVYKKFNPENGWGSYEGLVEFVESYLRACQQYPEARVEVSR